jgi:hypothetical protein
MALLNCYECGKPVSDQATACPHCGAPVKNPVTVASPDALSAPAPKRKTRPIVQIFWGAVLLIFSIAYFGDGTKSDASPSANASTTESKCAEGDLQCLGNKGIVAAGVYCKDEVEKLAKHSVRWTDGTFETKFSHFRWRNKARQQVTYIGNKAEFQNGFGAYTPVVYECDLDEDNKTVLDVRVREGRMPK